MNKNELSKTIYKVSNIKGNFKLRSGIYSNEYFDKYLFESNPEILENIAKNMLKLLPTSCDLLAGLELGGIPIATMMSFFSGMPIVFIRKKVKEYGTCKIVEGANVCNKTVVIIEDIVSTGGAIIDAVSILRKIGGKANDVICVIDRESGGSENLEKHNLVLRSLFKKSELEK